MTDTTRDRLRITGPDCLPLVVPHLCGFHPERSFVVLGLLPGSDTVAVSLRADLPPDEPDDADVQALSTSIGALAHVGASEAIVVVMPGLAGQTWSEVIGDVLPYGMFAAELEDLLRSHGVGIRDAVCIVGERVASYLCEDLACCPREGRAVPPHERDRVLAALVGSGSAPLATRADLEAILAPRPVDDPVRRAVRRARDGVLLRMPVGAVAQVCGFVTDVARWGARPRSGVALQRLACAAALLLERVPVRDLLLRELTVTPDHEVLQAARSVLVEAVRCAEGTEVAPPAAALAVLAWACGDGALARIAAERALDADPAYSLADLVRSALDRGLPPSTWTEAMRSIPLELLVPENESQRPPA